MTTPAGWYPDPQSPDSLRYWDGGHWTNHSAPGTPPLTPKVVQSPTAGESAEQVSFSGAKKRAEQLQRENHQLRGVLDRLGAMDAIAVEAEINRPRGW